MDKLDELSYLVQKGENVEAVSCANDLLTEDCPVEEVVDAISKGLEVLRNKCTIENFQLLDVLLASRAMVEVVDECIATRMKENMDDAADAFNMNQPSKTIATIVIGAILGDVHDLGKHIVATLCRFNNFRVIDLGKDVPVEKFVDTAIKENADFIGVSSLMTVSMGNIEHIKTQLAEKGFGHIAVIGGGAAIQQSSCESLNLDYVAQDAFDGLDFFCNQNSHKVDLIR